MADTAAPGPRAAPRIILSTERREKSDASEVAPHLLDWKARFGRRSPLSRKIITFNLVALGVLLTGVLYLNQFQGGLIVLQERSMVTEGRLVANALAEQLTEEGLTTESRPQVMEALASLQAVSGARFFLYDGNGRLVSRLIPKQAEGESALQVIQIKRPSAFVSIMGDMWDRASRLFGGQKDTEVQPLLARTADPLAAQVLDTGVIQRRQRSTPDGDLVLSIAFPVVVDETIVGALVVTSAPGDIDAFIRGEREKILQVFALAIISSIVLSLVLANTIVRPLRDLSEAAHEGGMRNTRQVNPERINIPDMTARPDEIGYLSGAMRVMTKALYDRIEANEVFAADVAHEIKNPLTSLRSAVDTMPYAKTEDDRQRLIGVIRKDVNRLDRLVTDISNASRLDSELVRDRMEKFDLHALLGNLVEFNEQQAKAVGATLRTVFGKIPKEITGLEGRLAQVFVNLITNAISFASEGDRITVRTEPVGQHKIRVVVEDEGPGIPEENLKDVFERFYSERPTKEEFGNHSGLGLAISKQIVVAHGGSIWAENIRPPGSDADIPPQGARFVVELPV